IRLPGAISKKFTSCVRPGVLLTRASLRAPKIALMALDLPEFERPTKATSRPSSRGKSLALAALFTNFGALTARRRAASARSVSVQSAPVSAVDGSDRGVQAADISTELHRNRPRGRFWRHWLAVAIAVGASATAVAQTTADTPPATGSIEAGKTKAST